MHIQQVVKPGSLISNSNYILLLNYIFWRFFVFSFEIAFIRKLFPAKREKLISVLSKLGFSWYRRYHEKIPYRPFSRTHFYNAKFCLVFVMVGLVERYAAARFCKILIFWNLFLIFLNCVKLPPEIFSQFYSIVKCNFFRKCYRRPYLEKIGHHI